MNEVTFKDDYTGEKASAILAKASKNSKLLISNILLSFSSSFCVIIDKLNASATSLSTKLSSNKFAVLHI